MKENVIAPFVENQRNFKENVILFILLNIIDPKWYWQLGQIILIEVALQVTPRASAECCIVYASLRSSNPEQVWSKEIPEQNSGSSLLPS